MFYRVLENWKQPNGKYKCPKCPRCFGKQGLAGHFWRKHTIEGCAFVSPSHKAWNKGLTAKTDERIKKYVESCSRTLKGKPCHPQSLVVRKRISKSMRKA